MSHGLIVAAYSKDFLLDRKIGVIAGAVAFFALVMRVPVRREVAAALDESPRAKGIFPRQAWFPTWFIKTPNGWKRLDRALVFVAIGGAAVVVLTLAVVPFLGH